MSSQSGFWYPRMKVSDIKTCLDGYNIQVSESQIQKPTADFVQSIYSFFLQRVTGLTRDVLEEPARQALATIDEYSVRDFNQLMLCGSCCGQRDVES